MCTVCTAEVEVVFALLPMHILVVDCLLITKYFVQLSLQHLPCTNH